MPTTMTDRERLEMSDDPSHRGVSGGAGPHDAQSLLSEPNTADLRGRAARSSSVRRRLRVLTALAAIGGFLFGYDTGVISGAMPAIARAFELNSLQEEAVVSSTVLSAFASSLIGGTISRKYGRRFTILCASSIFTVGAIQMGVAWSYASLVMGRLIVGGGIGLASLSTPIYLAEVAPPDMRGTLVTINGLLICFGQFSAGMVDGILNEISPSDGWRGMLGLAAIPSVIMFVGFRYMPESPRWLVMQGRDDEALIVLKSVRESNGEASDELQEIVNVCSIMTTDGGNDDYGISDHDLGYNEDPTLEVVQSAISRGTESSFGSQVKTMLENAPTRRALKLGCGIMVLQQLSGINTVMYYAASIYEMSGFKESTAVWLSGFTALAQVAGVGIGIYFIERKGRRPLVLSSLFFVTLSLFGLGACFYLSRIRSGAILDPKYVSEDSCSHRPAMVWSGTTSYCFDCVSIEGCGFCGGVCGEHGDPRFGANATCAAESNRQYEGCDDSSLGYLTVLFMVTYLFSFGTAMGPLPWTINSEIYPLEFRSLAVSFSTATNWIGNFLVSATFLTISSPGVLTQCGAFWLYGFVALLGFACLSVTLPETKGLTLEQIEDLFRKPGDAVLASTLTSEQKEAMAAFAVSAGGH